MKLFALYRDRVGHSELELELPTGAPVSEALGRLQAQFPVLRNLIATTAVAVNLEYASFSQVLQEGDEMALIPPVSGGRS